MDNSVRAKKHLGQHFLADAHYARKIADAVPASRTDSVLEIGPGTGALSVHLQERFPRFHMVELDSDVVPVLQKRLGQSGWTIHQANALSFDFEEAGFPLHVVGNLPYVTGARIIHKALMYGSRIRSCTFMVQREVAERIAASPHGKTIGYLSIFCQFFGTPRILFHVPPGAFVPPPTVQSSVFQIAIEENVEEKLPVDQWKTFFHFVDIAYRMRRKVLPNALAPLVDKQVCARALAHEGLAELVRPEDLSVDEWLRLFTRVRGGG